MIYTYKIFQTENRNYIFMSFDFAMKHGFKRNDYKSCFRGTVEATCINEALEKLWVRHNADDRPARNTMRSLSVSDVVTINETPYYCDRFGWSEIPSEKWRKICLERMQEIAEKAISYIVNNDLFEDFAYDTDIDLDDEEKLYFGIEDEDEEED